MSGKDNFFSLHFHGCHIHVSFSQHDRIFNKSRWLVEMSKTFTSSFFKTVTEGSFVDRGDLKMRNAFNTFFWDFHFMRIRKIVF